MAHIVKRLHIILDEPTECRVHRKDKIATIKDIDGDLIIITDGMNFYYNGEKFPYYYVRLENRKGHNILQKFYETHLRKCFFGFHK